MISLISLLAMNVSGPVHAHVEARTWVNVLCHRFLVTSGNPELERDLFASEEDLISAYVEVGLRLSQLAERNLFDPDLSARLRFLHHRLETSQDSLVRKMLPKFAHLREVTRPHFGWRRRLKHRFAALRS